MVGTESPMHAAPMAPARGSALGHRAAAGSGATSLTYTGECVAHVAVAIVQDR